MAKQTINIGASPNDGTGTPLRTSFDYCNLNFTELYTAVGPSGNNIVCPGSATITGALTVDTTTLVVDPTNDRVGIGTATPAAKLIVRDGSNRNLLVSSDATQLGSAGIAIGSFTDNAAGYAPLSIIAGTSMAFGMNGTTAMTINSTGLGVGVTPYVSWPATSKALQLGASSAIEGRTNDGSRTSLYTNAVWNGTNLIYQNSALASYYLQSSGVHSWYTAPAGTANDPISFGDAKITLDASGRLILLASTTTPATLATNGELTFTATSNTNLRFSYRGSDGTTRVANLTLA
jgi:hypothetical protein